MKKLESDVTQGKPTIEVKSLEEIPMLAAIVLPSNLITNLS
jgi:hypothetical protein